MEIFRADLDQGNVGPLSAPQFIAVVEFGAAALFVFLRGRSVIEGSHRSDIV
jgi:hypothetical protein